jgi:hypothetical protein
LFAFWVLIRSAAPGVKVQVDTYPWATGGIMGNLKKQRRKKIAKHKRRKRLKAMRHKNK